MDRGWKLPIASAHGLAIATLALSLSACSIDSKTSTARLSVAHPQQELPGPKARALRLVAIGGQACDQHLRDIETDESQTAVRVSASFQLELGGCDELRTAIENFEITLRRPLGHRVVIDASRGRRAVIWSPDLRRKTRQTALLTNRDALRFASSRFPQAAGSRCIPMGPYFECRYLRHGQRYRLILRKELGGEFSVFDPPVPDPTCPLKGGQRGCPPS